MAKCFYEKKRITKQKNLILWLLCFVLSFLWARPVGASNVTVNSLTGLQAAISPGTADTIYVQPGTYNASASIATISRNVVIIGQGEVILVMSNTFRHFSVSGNATVVLKNLIFLGPNATFAAGDFTPTGTSNTGGGISTAGSGLTKLIDCKIGGCYAATGGAIQAASSLALGGNIYLACNTAGTNGGGISKTENGTFTAENLDTLTIDRCEAKGTTAGNTGNGGGAIHLRTSLDLSAVKKTTISNCKAVREGGGIFMVNPSGNSNPITLKISNATVTGCYAGDDGGGLESFGGSYTIMVVKNCVFTNNAAARYGGGIGTAGDLYLEGKVVVDGNSAGSNGGGISQWQYGFVTDNLDTLMVTNNTVTGSAGGGGIWTESDLDLTPAKQVIIRNNISAGNGGGIYTVLNSIHYKGQTGKLKFGRETTISENKAGYKSGIFSGTGNGGGVYVVDTLYVQAGARIINNAANQHGGGIYAVKYASVDGATVTGNTAGLNGGGIYASAALSLSNVTISENKAGYKNGVYTGTCYGGGVYANNALILSGSLLFERDTANSNGGAIYKNTTNPFTGAALDTLIIKDNSSIIGSGGGIFTAAATDLSNSKKLELRNNTAATTGGSIYASAALTLANATLSENAAGQHGGGIYANAALTLANATISENKAGYKNGVYNGSYYGGGVYANNALTLSGSLLFERDTASHSGGAIYKGNLNPFIGDALDTLVVRNNASIIGAGGGIFTAATTDLSSVKKLELLNNTASTNGGGIATPTSGTLFSLNMANAVINNNVAGNSGGGLYSFFPLTLKNATISENKAGYKNGVYSSGAYYGGGVYANNALTLSGNLLFERDTAGNSGGAIYKNTINPFIGDALDTLIIKDNSSINGSGGGIYTGAATDLSIVKKLELLNNTASTHGGGIYTSISLILANATISENKAGLNGGGISTPGSGTPSLAITNAVINNNSSGNHGGGIYSYGALTLENSTVSDNKAGYKGGTYLGVNNGYNGGGVYANNALTLKGTIAFTDNNAAGNGGAIYKLGGVFTCSEIDSLSITGNAAQGFGTGITGNGGGVYSGVSFTANKWTVSDNIAIRLLTSNSGNGGGIYLTSTTVLTVSQSTFAGNNAVNGGAIYSQGNTADYPLTVINSTFSRNNATTNGGALVSDGTSSVTLLKIAFSTFNGNTAGSNTGHAIYSKSTSNDVLNGNIIYGNGSTGSEINNAGATSANYNITLGNVLPGTTNLALTNGEGANLFDQAVGDVATLAYDGGMTPTIRIKEGGAAHNFIPETALNDWTPIFGVIATDQRDSLRVYGCDADAGAVEIHYAETASYTLANGKEVCYNSWLNADSLITSATGMTDTLYYADRSYTTLSTMPVQVTQDKIYVKFVTVGNCERYDSISLNIIPRPELTLSTRDTTICSGSTLDLSATISDVSAVRWTNYESTGSATGETTATLHYTSTVRSRDTTVYIYITAQGNSPCETLTDSVKVRLVGKPTAVISGVSADSVCAEKPLTFTLTTTNLTYFEWTGGNGVFEPVRVYASNPYDYFQENFTYKPALSERNTTVKLVLKTGGGACGYLSDTLKLFVLPQTTTVGFELTSQPQGLQSTCKDTIYELKIKSIDAGGLTNLQVALFDEGNSGIIVDSLIYAYPYNGNWQHGTSAVGGSQRYAFGGLPDLRGDDSLRVRFHVHAPCGFLSGSKMRFELMASDVCDGPIPAIPALQSEPYTLRSDATFANTYRFENQVYPTLINSQNGDTLTYHLKLYFSGSQASDSTRENIVSIFPLSLVPIEGSLERIHNAGGTLRIDTIGQTYRFHLSIPSGLTNDYVEIKQKFYAGGMACVSNDMITNLTYTVDAICDIDTCHIESVRADTMVTLSVERYTFSLASIQGLTEHGTWSGDIQMNALNGFFAGDSLKVDFYVDLNADNRYNPTDSLVATRYVKTPTPADIPNGGILPVHFSNIPVKPGYQLIAHSNDPLLCSALQFPITVITGPDTVCKDQIAIFRAAEGMTNYSFDAVTGATRVPITTIADYPKQNEARVRWLTAEGSVEIKGRYSRIIGNDTIPSEKTSFRTFINPPVTHEGLKTVGGGLVFCTPETATLYVSNLQNATTKHWTLPQGVAALSGTDADTLVIALPARSNDTTITFYFTAQSLPGCRNLTDSITLSLYAALTQTAPASGDSVCYNDNWTFYMPEATGGHNNIYQWQDSTRTTGWANVTGGVGADSAEYITAPLTDTVWFRRIVTSSCGLSDTSAVAMVAVLPPFNAGEIAADGQTFCAGQAALQTINSISNASGGDVNGITYSWFVNGNEIPGSNTPSHTPDTTNPGVYTYIRQAKDSYCRTSFEPSAGSWVLTINIEPGLVFITDSTVCAGETVDLNSLAIGDNNTSVTFYTAINGSVINPAIVTPSNTTKYYVLYSNSSATCTSWDSLTINVMPLPVLTIVNNDTAICYGSSIDLAGMLSVNSNEQAFFYTDTTGSALSSSIVVPDASTRYYVKVQNMLSGCMSSGWDSVSVVVNALPVLNVTTYSASICEGKSLDLATMISLSVNEQGLFYTDSTALPLASSVVTPAASEVYYVKVRNTVTGCESSWDSLSVNVNPTWVHTEAASVCQGTPYQWRGRNIPTDKAGNFSYGDTLTTVQGCDSLMILNMEVYAAPVITSLTATPVTQGGVMILSPVNLQATPSAYMNYLFTLNNQEVYNGPNSMITLSSPLYYNKRANHATVEVTDGHNCKNTASADFNLKVTIPNAFQPNGDGYNDYFLKGYTIKIFNRYGHVLYQGKDGWDGRYKGQDVPAGTYFYELHLPVDERTTETLAGSVLLER